MVSLQKVYQWSPGERGSQEGTSSFLEVTSGLFGFKFRRRWRELEQIVSTPATAESPDQKPTHYHKKVTSSSSSRGSYRVTTSSIKGTTPVPKSPNPSITSTTIQADQGVFCRLGGCTGRRQSASITKSEKKQNTKVISLKRRSELQNGRFVVDPKEIMTPVMTPRSNKFVVNIKQSLKTSPKSKKLLLNLKSLTPKTQNVAKRKTPELRRYEQYFAKIASPDSEDEVQEDNIDMIGIDQLDFDEYDENMNRFSSLPVVTNDHYPELTQEDWEQKSRRRSLLFEQESFRSSRLEEAPTRRRASVSRMSSTSASSVTTIVSVRARSASTAGFESTTAAGMEDDLEVWSGDLVWFDPGVGHVLPGEVLEFHRAAQVLTVQALIGGKPQIFTLTTLNGVRRRQDLGQNGIEDMIQLSDLNEASLLWNLKIRYDKELIYTYTGSILVAVNPYKMFDIYGLDMVKTYEGQILGTLPPHLFAIGSAAYSHMSKEGSSPPESQVVVISGESGSGKTESTKLVMQYLAAVNKSSSNLVTEQILEASPLLESFGNAKTVRNDNSSRFGKYLEVHFKNGVINGAKVTEYLLEKSRIVTQAPDERNYHVFYEMLAGLKTEQKEKYGLLTPEKYFYLNQGGSYEIDGKYDGEDFQSLLSAMQVLGLSSEEQDTILRILSTVLHLGNVYFHRKQLRHGQEGVEIGSDAEVRWAAHLLSLNIDGIKRALTTKTTEARNERVLTPLTIDQALDARDAFAKALYNALFSWLVARINQIVFKGTKRTASISILDIFGFEDFKENSFEQLCINYANENLQFYFNKHIFKLEQQEYAKERIEWQTISYTDNLPVIHLIAKKPVGLLHLLDDESNFPRATDVSFLEKCHYNHALDELYSRPRLASMEFGVRHYAGQVWYAVDGFLDKNRDTLRQDVVELLIGSKIPMLSQMFQHLRSTHEASKTLNKANGRFVTMKPRTPTVAARFHDSLQQLLDSMAKCNPWFVRCIKPNGDKAAMRYDMPVVLEQLRYTGMLDTIRIRKTGYPIRLKFSQFVERFRYLLPHKGSAGAPHRELCRAILVTADPSSTEHQIGATRVFLREPLERSLESQRAGIVGSAAVTLQRHVRGHLARRRFTSQRKAVTLIQAQYRGWRERSKYVKVRKGVVKAQALYRGRTQRSRYQQLKVELLRRAETEKLARERAKAKAQRDEQERVSRAVAGVNHLEIPAELAFIFSKLDDWTPTHSERNLVKVVGGVAVKPERHRLPGDIDQHAFAKFTNIYFKSHLWGMKREPIKTPFLAKSKDMDYQDSLALFKLILRFMNDNNLSGKKEVALGDYIVNKGIVNEKLRDEILCQLCNQTWRNDNDANNERGWLLMANCLSAFPPSKTLHKYLLKYVSDHGYNGYKAICQRKLLQSSKVDSQLARRYPPCLLEWRSNRKRVNMALDLHFADGETRTSTVDSWTTSEELAANVVQSRGLTELEGWTVSLVPDLDSSSNGDVIIRDSNGLDYTLDLIGEMELAPAFPACKDSFLSSTQQGQRGQRRSMKVTPPKISPTTVPGDAEDPPPSPRRPVVPPPEPPVVKQPLRKLSHEPLRETKVTERVRSQSRDQTGLSRKSALNDRYFEDKGRSRSLDNLLDAEQPVVRKLDGLGLSHSRLNERYHSIEKVNLAVTNQEYMTRAEAFLEENFESVSQRGDKYNSRATDMNSSAVLDRLPSDILIASSNPRDDVTMDFDYPDMTGRSEDDKGSYLKGNPRFIKSSYAGKKAAPGSHSSRAYIDARNSEKSEYGGKSSALSDTSEAPSLASHVRRVRVPSQASDVDQFLDDLFMPVLDGNLDELSDARSLAASIKGGGKADNDQAQPASTSHRAANLDVDEEVATITSATSTLRLPRDRQSASGVENVDDYITALFKPIFVNASLQRLTKADKLARQIKGGGRVETQPSQSQQQNAFNFTPIGSMTSPTPMMMSGMMSPPPMMMPSMGMFSPGVAPFASPAPMASYYSPADMLASMTNMAGMTGMTSMTGMTGMAGSPQMGQMSPQQGFMPVPIYNMQGMNLPQFGAGMGMAQPAMGSPSIDPSLAAAYQQNLQRAFLQSAMAHNMQVQQQLMAQNQALQHMLVQPAQQPNQGQQPLSPHTPAMGYHSSMHSGVGRKAAPPFRGDSPVNSYDAQGTSAKVSFREPEGGDLWSNEKQRSPGYRSGAPPQLPIKTQPRTPPGHGQQGIHHETTIRAQVHRAHSPTSRFVSPSHSGAVGRRPTPTKSGPVPSNSSTAFTSVLTELKSRKSSVESSFSHSKGSPGMSAPPPPPPMPPPPEPGDPSETRPFLDPYGRAKTVRIGKWRWPPPKAAVDEAGDSFLLFKHRQHHQRKTTPQQMQEYGDGEGVEWEEFEIEGLDATPRTPTTPSAATPGARKESRGTPSAAKRDSTDNMGKTSANKSFDTPSRGSPASIGKLRISSEMRSKLEMVTANHSVRSTNKPEKAGVKAVLETPQRPVKKLEDNRKMLLEQQLAGRWDTVDSVQAVVTRGVSKEERPDVQQTNIVRSQVERMEKPVVGGKSPNGWDIPRLTAANNGWEKPHSGWDVSPIANQSNGGWDKPGSTNASWRPAPPPPPVTPGHFHDAQPSRTSSFYSHSMTPALPQPRSPPPPIQPVKSNREMFNSQYSNNRDMFGAPPNGREQFHENRNNRDNRDTFHVQNNRDNRDSFHGNNRDNRDSFGHPYNGQTDVFGVHQSNNRIDRDRRSSVSTHLTDKMERIEIDDSPEFLPAIDSGAPTTVPDRRDQPPAGATRLYPPSGGAHFAYNRVAWRLRVRKEVFAPGESLTGPLALHLVYCQVVQDTLAPGTCVRIAREQRVRMKKLLDSYGVTLNNLQSGHQKVTIKKNIVDVAKDWPTYFARIFPVSGGHQHPSVQHLAVSHSGVRLTRLEKSTQPDGDALQVLDTIGFDDIVDTCVPKASAVEIALADGGRITLYTHRANQIQDLIARYAHTHDKIQQKSAPRITADSYHQQQQQQQQPHNGKAGADWGSRHLAPAAVHQHPAPAPAGMPVQRDAVEPAQSQHDGKHSLLQFAMHHFRASPEKFEMLKTADGSISGSLKVIESLKSNKKKAKKDKEKEKEKTGSANKENDWTWKEQVDLVKFTSVPVEMSLLRLDSPELSDLAVECFASVMRYMGDLPMSTDLSEVKCVYTILMHCHKHESLRDEVYCQLMKQTTNNKSANPDSCQRGWRLFSIVAAYFICSDMLKPYLFKYLETAAYDKRRAYHGTATVCLQNLRKTFRHGGRKNVPSVEELTAISAGRNSKRQIYQLPGGSERVVNTKSTTVVQDVIEEMCAVINVQAAAEMEEFSLYCIVEGDTFTMPLARDEYILDVTTELHKNQQVFYLIFCRSVWHFPLRLDSQLYIEVVFNQIAPDYLEGLLLVMPGEQLEQDVIYDIAKMATLLHRAADMTHLPTMKETKFLLPKPALAVRDVKPGQWVNMVQGNWREVEPLQTIQAKAQVLEILSKWPLFGSSFFAVKRISEPKERAEHILALNRHGVHFIDLVTHETLMHYTFSEVISTRKVKSEDGTLFLDMKCGNLMQQRITRLQTDQAHEISRLIRQYITMEQKLRP